MDNYIDKVIKLATANVDAGGGPFAALVVRDGEVIATGVNQVTQCNDPTAHAEIVAIREACRRLGSFQLEGCDVFASCEPCPMCLGALYWARPRRVFFSATRYDAAEAGFDDSHIYREFLAEAQDRALPLVQIASPLAIEPFRKWAAKPDRLDY